MRSPAIATLWSYKTAPCGSIGMIQRASITVSAGKSMFICCMDLPKKSPAFAGLSFACRQSAVSIGRLGRRDADIHPAVRLQAGNQRFATLAIAGISGHRLRFTVALDIDLAGGNALAHQVGLHGIGA